MDPVAIDGDLELVRVLEPTHGAEIGPKQLDADLVLAVERQRRTKQDPPVPNGNPSIWRF
jgi:hypothetical protein